MPKIQSAPQQDACFRTCLHKKHMWIFEHNLPKRHVYTLVKTGSQSTFSYSYGKCDKSTCTKASVSKLFLDAVSPAQTQKSEAVCRSVSKSMQKRQTKWQSPHLAQFGNSAFYPTESIYTFIIILCLPFVNHFPHRNRQKMQIVNTLTALYPFQKYCYKKCTAFSFSLVSRQIYIFC